MTEKIKVRNVKNERKYLFVFNVLALAAVLTAEYFLLPGARGIHGRYSAAAFTLNGCMTVIFMWLLEKYAMIVSGGTLYERLIITFLSSLYSCLVMCAANLMFFSSQRELMIDAVSAAASIAGVFASDALAQCVFGNPRRYRRQRLLIIVSEEKNFLRMKRAKYGVLNRYDAWYEIVSGKSAGEMRSFTEEKFPHYEAVCVFDDLSEDEYGEAVSAAIRMNKTLFIVPKLTDVGMTNAKIAIFDDIITFCTPKRTLSRVEMFIKRAADIVFSIVGLIIGAVPMLLIAAAIKITSPGPVFYKQTRLTKGKREFEILKFRTMVKDAEKLSGPKFAEKNDPRITPVGRVIRACRLDELPQFINVLKGDMSLVGPRPERPVFVKRFEEEIGEYGLRFEVRAGLTSLSHVYGRYSTYIHDRTYYDLYYIINYSLLLDIKILLLTTKTMLMFSSASGEDDFKEKTVAADKEGGKVVEDTHQNGRPEESPEYQKSQASVL